MTLTNPTDSAPNAHEKYGVDTIDLLGRFGPCDVRTMPIVQHFDPSIKAERGLRLAVSTFIEVEVELVFS